MKVIANYLSFLIAILLYSGYSNADTSHAQLTKNPFIKPTVVSPVRALEKTESQLSHTLSDGSLRATLSSDEDSIANVEGLMVFVGDKVKGYELISVGVGTATFAKDGKKITLNVSEKHKQLKK
ncbi:MAG: hypothetical protein OEQ24_08995 [Gammaproteobacteria bacterium]|nr:hypothetical protein [Gammaproteobacteria bacterium]